MELDKFFKGIVDADYQPVVICNPDHKIIYLNPAAKARYEKDGNTLVGKSILCCHNERSQEIIKQNVLKMQSDKNVNMIFETHSTRNGGNNDVYTAAIRDENGVFIGYYEKFECKNLYDSEN